MNPDGGAHGGIANDFGAGGDTELENVLRISLEEEKARE